MDEGLSEENIAKGVEPPKPVTKVISTFSDGEIITMLRTLSPNKHSEARNLTVFMLLLDIGLRIGELVNLKMEDVHVNEGFLKVMSKGREECIVPISGTMLGRHYSAISSAIGLDPLTRESKMSFCQFMAIP